MDIIFFLVTFIFGTFIGSFLNVVILRMNTGRGLGGRSHCMSCGKVLGAHELIPVWSYVIQGGKCRSCKSRLSLQYPIVEALSGLVSALIFWKFRVFLNFEPSYYSLLVAYSFIVFSLLLVIFIYDLKHKIIPDNMAYAFIIFSFFAPFVYAKSAFILYHISWLTFLSGPLVALPLFLLWFISRGKWMGFGDVKLALGIGYFLGWSAGFAALFIGFWSGAIVGIILLLSKGKEYSLKSQIPFAPFLIFGLALAFFFAINLASLSMIFIR